LPPLSALPAAQQPFAYQRLCCTARFVSTNLGWLEEVSTMGRAVSHGLQKELVFRYVFLVHSLSFPLDGAYEDFFGSAYWYGDRKWSLEKTFGFHFLFYVDSCDFEAKADRCQRISK
jgi:hypothetical protein